MKQLHDKYTLLQMNQNKMYEYQGTAPKAESITDILYTESVDKMSQQINS